MRKATLYIMILTILAKILGFGREIALSYYYGVSYISDAYLISLIIPGTIFAFIGTALATSYIPIYSEIVNDRNGKSALEFTRNIISLILIVCTIIIIAVLFFTPSIVKLFASGFDDKTLELATLFTRIGIFSIYFSGLIFVFNGYLQVRNSFVPSVLSGIPLNIFVIFSIVVSAGYSLNFLAVGNVIAIFIQFLFLAYFVSKKGLKYSFSINIKDTYIKKMMFLALPVIIGISVNQINVLIDNTLASRISTGGISALSYSNRINLFVQGIFVMSIATVFYPTISKMAAEKNTLLFKKVVEKAVIGICFFVIPATLGTMLFSKSLISLLYGRGAFDSEDIIMTSSTLFYYSIGMIGFGLREILSRAFYALQDTKTPMVNASVGIVINILLNFVLSQYMGLSGLALATSISALLTSLLLFITLSKKIGRFEMKHTLISILKIFSASIVMVIISRFLINFLVHNRINEDLSLLIAIFSGGLIYLIVIKIFKVKEIDDLTNSLRKRLKLKKL